MKIEHIKLSQPEHPPHFLNDAYCSEEVRTSGTATFPGRRKNCRRFAVFIIDGEKLCKLHAGDKALKHLMSEEEK